MNSPLEILFPDQLAHLRLAQLDMTEQALHMTPLPVPDEVVFGMTGYASATDVAVMVTGGFDEVIFGELTSGEKMSAIIANNDAD